MKSVIYKRLSVLFCLLFFTLLVPAEAQVLKRGIKSLVRNTTREESKIAIAIQNAAKAAREINGLAHPESAAAESGLSSQLKAAATAAGQSQIQETVKRMQQSVFIVLSEQSGLDGNSAGFIFETSYKGKREIWGVTSALLEPETELSVRFINAGKPYDLKGNAVQVGLANPAGIVLISFPQTQLFLETVTPLKLAGPPSRAETEVFSYGFFMKGKRMQFLPFVPGKVAESSPNLLLVQDLINPPHYSAIQGVPLLNGRQEVIGMYAGAFAQRTLSPAYNGMRYGTEVQPVPSAYPQVSYAVSSAALTDLVRAYHQGGLLFRPLRWRGQEITILRVDERVMRIFRVRAADAQESAVGKHYLGPHERGYVTMGADTWGKSLDETRLELFLDDKGIIALEFWIEQYDGNMRFVSVSLDRGDITGMAEDRVEYLLD